MINIERFFEVQFDDPNINRQQLRKFTEDHLKRLAVNNDKNLYDLMITDTQAAYETYFGALTDTDVSNSVQQSRTKSMNNIKKLIQTTLSRRAGLITNSIDKDIPEYQEFFPHGLTEYSNATLENIETLMDRMITASAAHADLLGNTLTAEFANLKAQFLSARGKQLSQKGATDKASETTEESRHIIEIQLTKNLLTIALNNIGNIAAAALFFDKSIIGRSSSGDDTEPEEPKPEPDK